MSRVLWVLAVVLAFGCESKEIDSESHFLCARDSECGEGTCVEGRCQSGRGVNDTGGRSGATGSGGRTGMSGTGGVSGASGLGGATSSGGDGGAPRPDGATNGGTGGAPRRDGGTSSGGMGGASSLDAATGSGGTGGVAGPIDGATNSGGASNLDGATNSGGTGGVSEASSGGTAADAGIDASTDAELVAACSVTSTTLLSRAGSDVDQITLDGAYLYFHDGSGVSRVPRSGGNAVRLANFHSSSFPPEHAFVLDDTWITWREVGSSADGSLVTSVNRAAKTGGPVTTLATLPAAGTLNYSSIALGPAGSVFLWTGPGALTPVLLQVLPDGAVKSWGQLYFYYNNSNDVVFDGSDVFATGDNGVYIHVTNSFYDGFTSVTNASAAQNIVLDGATIYIGSSDASGYVSVYSAPKAGGTSSMLYSGMSSGIYLGNLAIDANYLYVVERVPATILRMGKDGANPTEIVKGVQSEQFEHVAVDDGCIYWSVHGSNQGPNRTPSGVYASPK